MRALKCNKRLSQRDPSGAELQGITRLIIKTDANINWRIAPVPLCAATTVLKCYDLRLSQQVLYSREVKNCLLPMDLYVDRNRNCSHFVNVFSL